MSEVFCYYVDMPYTVRGLSVINPDGSLTIYINTKLNREQQLKAYIHEIKHLKNDDFYNTANIQEIELCNH